MLIQSQRYVNYTPKTFSCKGKRISVSGACSTRRQPTLVAQRTGTRRAAALIPSLSGECPGGCSICGGRAEDSRRIGPSLFGRGVRKPRVPVQRSPTQNAARRTRFGETRPRRQVAFIPKESPAAAYRHDEKANT